MLQYDSVTCRPSPLEGGGDRTNTKNQRPKTASLILADSLHIDFDLEESLGCSPSRVSIIRETPVTGSCVLSGYRRELHLR